ncbi:MAG: PAS domain S-box protein [Armatimonadetes bacterium]|nr:PAS domain S-box protein [Armatimonadota bacterium]
MPSERQEELADDRFVPVGLGEREKLARFLEAHGRQITQDWLARSAADEAVARPYLAEGPDGAGEVAASLLALIEHVREGGHDMHLPAHAAWLQCWHETGMSRGNIRDHFHALRDVTLEALERTDTIGEAEKRPLRMLLEAAVRNLRLETSEYETRRLLAEAVAERQRYQGLFDTSADSIVIVDLESLEILDANPAAERLLERTRSELQGLPLRALHDDLPLILPGLLAPRPDGRTPTYNLPLRRRDGSLMVVAINATTLEYGGHRASQVLMRDITERVRFREELARRADELQEQVAGQVSELERLGTFLENIIDALPARLLVLDENLNVLHANQAYLQERRNSDPVAGRHITEVFPRELLEDAGLLDQMRQTLETGSRLRWSAYRQPTPDHNERLLDIAIEPCPGAEGQRYLLVTLEDVTERQRQFYARLVLHHIVEAMLGVRDVDRLVHTLLTGITAGGAVGLGFNRAVVLLADEEARLLRAEQGVGPESPEEAGRVWSELSTRLTLEQFLADYEHLPPPEQRPLRDMIERLVFPLDDKERLPALAAHSRETIHVLDAGSDPRVPPELAEALGADEFVVAPMVVQDRIIGVAIADNRITQQSIHGPDIELLTALTNQAALAIDGAIFYAQAKRRADELQEAYSKLEAATERLVRSEALAAIGEVTAIVAHEIRNPLSTIGGFARMLRRRCHEVEIVKRNARIIEEEVAKLEDILSGLLDFSKPSRPRLEACSLAEIIRASIVSTQGQRERGNFELIEQISEDLPLVPVDCHQMEQVVRNLIINALDAMPYGGKITVGARREGNQVILWVSDTGMGIPAHHLDQIFDHFFTTKPTGTGLGLALAKKIVEDHGARLEVSSEEGVGSTFSVIFNLDEGEPATPAVLSAGESGDTGKGSS